MEELATSCVDLISASHCRQRQEERRISKPDLQAAVLYGKAKLQKGRDGQRRWKFTYNGIVYITEYDKQTSVTCWAENQLPLESYTLSGVERSKVAEVKRRVNECLVKITRHTVLVVDQSGSMRNGDTMGHRSRSSCVFYMIANEIISIPLCKLLTNL